MIDDVTLDHLRTWIGRTQTTDDEITPELAHRFNAVADVSGAPPRPGEAAPLGVHWCLSPAVAPMSELGRDGHPARGGFLPPVALPRRMWAGGALTLHDPLQVGDRVQRHSTITDVQAKNGRSGALCFVTVEHAYRTGRGLAIAERHDIVYRGDATGPAPAAAETTPSVDARRERLATDPVLLFRYSAVTFNGHRIHYDRDYAREVEGYPGLVVHGPWQATRMLRLAAVILGRTPERFAFRGLSPLIDGTEAWLCALPSDSGLELWVEDEAGRRTMAATAG